MKRFLIILCVAAAAVACNNGKKDNPLTSREKELIGSWHCLSYTSSADLPSDYRICLELTSVRGAFLHVYSQGKYTKWEYTWKIEGNTLVLSGADYCPEITLENLDAQHLEWTLKDEKGTSRGSFVNVSKLLPGTWSIKWDEDTYPYTVEIESSGVSTWSWTWDTPGSSKYFWEVSANALAHLVVTFWANDWGDTFDILSVETNHISAISGNNKPVQFTR